MTGLALQIRHWTILILAAIGLLVVVEFVLTSVYDAVDADPRMVTVVNDLTYDVGIHGCEAGNPSDVVEIMAGTSIEFYPDEDCAVVDRAEKLLGCLRGMKSARAPVRVSTMDRSRQPCNEAHQ
jgi:hypothetical protein